MNQHLRANIKRLKYFRMHAEDVLSPGRHALRDLLIFISTVVAESDSHWKQSFETEITR